MDADERRRNGYGSHDSSPDDRPSTPNGSPIPAFLLRLMEDYARQLREAQERYCPDESLHARPTSTLDRPSHSSSATSSNMTDASPRMFSTYAGSTASSAASSVASSSLHLSTFSLPRAALDDHPHHPPASVSKTASGGSSTPVYTHAQRLEHVYSLPKEMALQEPLLPPHNFAMVSSFVYRSSFPVRKNFPFLRTLGLKSVLCVCFGMDLGGELLLTGTRSGGVQNAHLGGLPGAEPGVSGRRRDQVRGPCFAAMCEVRADVLLFFSRFFQFGIPGNKVRCFVACLCPTLALMRAHLSPR